MNLKHVQDKILVILVFAFFATFSMGCMSGSFREMNENYSPTVELEQSNLGIYARYDNLSISNRQAFENTFGTGDIRKKFMTFIEDSLPGAIYRTSRFKTVTMIPITKTYQFKDTTILINKKREVLFKIPKHDKILDFAHTPQHFILIMQNFFARKSTGLHQVLSCDYILWDNVKGKAVAIGTTGGKSFRGFSKNNNSKHYSWMPGLIGMVENIFSKSVFMKKRLNE